jgi:hypothetical protein
MTVSGEGILQAELFHHDKGDAVRKWPILVWPPSVRAESSIVEVFAGFTALL